MGHVTIGVTFPVELEEREAVILDEMIREKFAPDRATSLMPDEPSRLLHKVRDALKKFADRRRSDEEFVASLTNEERELIRSRRANMGRKEAMAALTLAEWRAKATEMFGADHAFAFAEPASGGA
jgi:hypothetical protein